MLTDPEKKLPCPVAGLPSAEESGEKKTHQVVMFSSPPPEVARLLNKRIREFLNTLTGMQRPDLDLPSTAPVADV